MSALAGFVTGFANVTAANILERKKEARDYFNKQVEYARTTGMENRRRVKQEADAALSMAYQLRELGVPEDIIKAQINQDPANLGNFVKEVNGLLAERQMTPEQWQDYIKVAGNFKAPDEDMATYIRRMYEPTVNALRDPTFEDDPQGSFWASMTGLTAMDEARRELGRTEIADGLTAEDLIRYGDFEPQRVGGQAVVTRNYEAVRGGEGLTIPQSAQVQELASAKAENAITQFSVDFAKRRGVAASPETVSPEDIGVLRDAVVAEILRMPIEGLSVENVKPFVDMYFESRGYNPNPVMTDVEEALGGPETLTEPPPVVPGTEGSQEAPPPSTVPSGASTEQLAPAIQLNLPNQSPTPAVIVTEDAGKLTLVRENDDGTATYMDEAGNDIRLAIEVARQFQ